METLIEGVTGIATEPGRLVMMIIGGILMYLGIKKEYEPTLLVPMGLGTILVNFPNSGVLSAGGEAGPFQVLFEMGISTELFPLLLFIGIGAMIDFGPLLQNPFLLLFGAAAQFGIFFTVIAAVLLGFDLNDAASIGIIGAADGPTSIFVANTLNSKYMGAIMVAAYSYMALVPIIQPVAIKAVTTKKERQIRMSYRAGEVSQTAKILFPVVISVVAGLIAPVSCGFLDVWEFVERMWRVGSIIYYSTKRISEYHQYFVRSVDFCQDAVRRIFESRYIDSDRSRASSLYHGFCRWSAIRKTAESIPQRKSESNDWCSWDLCFSNV